MDLFDLKDRKVLLVGSSGLLGSVWSELFKESDCTLFEADYPKYDLKYVKSIAQLHDDCVSNIGVPDTLILNSGIDKSPKPGTRNDKWDEDDIIKVNYWGHKYLLKEFEDDLINKDGIKRIIYISSLLGLVAADFRNYNDGFDKSMDYGASKRAFESIKDNLCVRWGRYNILINMLTFAMIDGKGITDEFKNKFLRNVPLGRPIFKDDLVRAMWGELINTYRTGQINIYDGGYTRW